jgi:tetratricopeptide (TPR) repeat protein
MTTTDQPSLPPDPPGLDGDLARLLTLLRLVEGAWALARFEDGAIRQRMIDKLRDLLAPLPVLEISLAGAAPDPLALLRDRPVLPDQPAPVVCFTGASAALADLCGYLDLQRDSLARLPHRLIFWVTGYDWRYLAEHAPNFYSRISGVFDFPGTTGARPATSRGTLETTRLPESGTASVRRLRPLITARNEAERAQLIEQQRRRMDELDHLSRPDARTIADAWYDLGGLYDQAEPYRWAESEAAYARAAQRYAQANRIASQAAALWEAGASARRNYAHAAAIDYLQRALMLYHLLEDRRGEAATLEELGDVQQFRDDRDAALASYQQALALFQATGDRLGEANVYAALSRLLIDSDPDESQRLLDRAVAGHEAIGSVYDVAVDLGRYGRELLDRGRAGEALPYLRQARDLFAARGITVWQEWAEELAAQAEQEAAD